MRRLFLALSLFAISLPATAQSRKPEPWFFAGLPCWVFHTFNQSDPSLSKQRSAPEQDQFLTGSSTQRSLSCAQSIGRLPA